MKYKYYFRKPKSEIVKDILKWLMIAGVVCIAATSPYFGINLMKGVKKWLKYRKVYAKKRITNTFKRLQKQGCIKIERKGRQIYIRLTEKGKKMAGWLQIDALKIKRPKKWDKKWRIVIFDISQLKKIYREAFRGKLKELGFYPLQKSVWIFPFDCRDEIELLRDFFGLNHDEMRLIVAQDIGPDDWLKKKFKI
jgi:DNA-binding PadR family transcriptional regulator